MAQLVSRYPAWCILMRLLCLLDRQTDSGSYRALDHELRPCKAKMECNNVRL